MSPLVKHIHTTTASSGTQTAQLAKGQVFKVWIDGQPYTGQKMVNGQRVHLKRQADALVLELEGREQALLQVADFFESQEGADASGLLGEVDPQTLFAAAQWATAGPAASGPDTSWGQITVPAATQPVTVASAGVQPSRASEGNSGKDGAGSGWTFALGGLALAALVGGGGSDKQAQAQPEPEPQPGAVVLGTFLAGPVVPGHGLTLQIYDLKGQRIGQGAIDDTGRYRVDLGTYRGGVVLKVLDADAGPDYMDEALRSRTDIGVVLMAVGTVQAGDNPIHVNPATTAAAALAGLNVINATGAGADLGALAGQVRGSDASAQLLAIEEANAAMARILGLSAKLVQTGPVTTVRPDGTPNADNVGAGDGQRVGQLAAALSGMAKTLGADKVAAVKQFVSFVNVSQGSAEVSNAGAAALILGGAGPTISPEQIALLLDKGAQVQASAFTASGVSALTPEVARFLTAAQVASIGNPQSIPVEAIKVMTPQTLRGLTGRQVSALTSAQMGALSPEQQAALTQAFSEAIELSRLTSAATANHATASTPALSVWQAAGITGVTAENLAAINSLLNTSGITGAANGDHDTAAELQAMVSAYLAVTAGADNSNDNDTTLNAAQLTALGLGGVINTAQERSLFDDVLDQASAGEVNSGAKLVALATAVQAVMDGTASSAQLALLGVTVARVTPDNLKAVQNAFGAADPASLTTLQTAVDNALTSFNAALATLTTAATNNHASASTPALSVWQAAGITGVTASNLAAINSWLNTTSITGAANGDHDTAAELQTMVSAYLEVVAGADNTKDNDITLDAAQLTALGLGGVINTPEERSLFDDMLDRARAVEVDSGAKLVALAITVQDFFTVVDDHISAFDVALATLTTAATNNHATASTPALSVWQAASISGVTAENLAVINSLLNMAGITGAANGDHDTAAELQAMVTAYLEVAAGADNTDDNDTTLDAAQLTALGLGGVINTAPERTLFDDVLDQASAGEVDTGAKLVALANGVNELQRVAELVNPVSGSYSAISSTLTPQQFTDLGITGVSADNLPAVLQALAGSSAAGTSNLSDLQTLVSAAVNDHTMALAALTTAATNNGATNTTPAITVWENAGITGVTAGNLAVINSLLNTAGITGAANGDHDTAAELQNMVTACLEVAAGADNTDDNDTTLDAAQLTALGLGGVINTAQERTLFDDVLDQASAGEVDSGAKLVALANAVDKIMQHATGGGQTISEAEFERIGIDATVLTPARATVLSQAIASIGASNVTNLQAITNLIDTTAPVVDLNGGSAGTGHTLTAATAVSTSGGTSRVALGNVTLAGTSGFTVQTWVMVDALPTGFGRLLSIAPAGQAEADALMVHVDANGRLAFEAKDATSPTPVQQIGLSAPIGQPLSAGRWYHVAVTVEGGAAGASKNAVLYVNGEQVSTTNTNYDLPSMVRQVTLGNANPGANPLDSSYAHARIYNGARTPTQIRGDMGGDLDTTSLLIAHPFTANSLASAAGGGDAQLVDAATLLQAFTPSSLDASGLAVVTEASGLASIKVKASNTPDGTAERLYVGGDFVNWTNASGTVNLFGGTWNYTFDVVDSSYTFTRSGTITAAAAQDFVKSLAYGNTLRQWATPGTRSFSVSMTDVAGNASVAAVSDVAVTSSVTSAWSVAVDQASQQADEAAGTMTFIVSRVGQTDAATIEFSTSSGTATAGSDYTAVNNQTLSFALGEVSKSVTVTIVNDTVLEGNETLGAVIGNPSTGVIAKGTAVATILDNDQSVWSVALAGAFSQAADDFWEVGEGAGVLNFTVSRTGSTGAASIDLSTWGLSATAGTDFAALNQTLNFTAGQTSQTVQVAITDDATLEGLEGFVAQIRSTSAGTIAQDKAAVRILDNDQSLWRVLVNASSEQAGEGAGFVSFTVSRTVDTGAATVDFSTTNGTATAGADYTAINNQQLSFAAGELSKTVTVAITEDALKEANETLGVAITNASAGTIATATAQATLLDNDQSVWRIAHMNTDDNSVSEAAGVASFVVSRTGSGQAATLDFKTGDIWPGNNQAAATPGVDFTVTTQTLSFAEGEMSKTVSVPLIDDNLAEALNEVFAGLISNPSTGMIATSAAMVQLLDKNNVVWSLTTGMASGTQTEIDEGAGVAVFTVTRSGDLSTTESVRFSISGGVAGTDYEALVPAKQTLTFAPWQTSQQVRVNLLDDAVADGNVTLQGTIGSASRGTIANVLPNTRVLLLDNDQSVWSVSTPVATVSEGAGLVAYTVSRTGASGAASIDFTAGGGASTATSGIDFTAITNQTLSFAAGEMSKTVLVALTDDATLETNETVVATLSGATSGTIGTATATATLVDNDQTVWSVVATSADVLEASGLAAFRVERTGPLTAATVTVNTGGTSTAGTDYTALTNQVLNFAEGEASKVVYVQVTDDTATERSETITLTASIPSTGVLGTASGSLNVWSDDIFNGTAANNSITLNASTGFFIDAGDGNDTLTLNNIFNYRNAFFKGGAGDDVFNITGAGAMGTGSLIDGGSGIDTLQLTVSDVSLLSLSNASLQSIERINLAHTITHPDTRSFTLDLGDLLDFNAVDVLRVDGTNPQISLIFEGFGAAQSTPTPTAAPGGSTINDETGTARTVVASTAGDAAANDVVIGARTYDVYQFTLNTTTATLLIDTALGRSITDVVI